ncbi:hypothetical protein [Enterobacter cloacae]|uniref:hypothetical protein n=1 Tax=Enterobacter cloacae TaxID=550 RepID=UPI0020CB18E2|nr:hypothetical protein [Enterobacter cloacae]
MLTASEAHSYEQQSIHRTLCAGFAYSGDVNGHSGRVNTDSGKMNSDSGHGAKSWYFPPEYAFTQNQKQRSRSARMAVHVGPEYAGCTKELSDGEVHCCEECASLAIAYRDPNGFMTEEDDG